LPVNKIQKFLKRAQLNHFGKYAVTRKLSSSEGKPARQGRQHDRGRNVRLAIFLLKIPWIFFMSELKARPKVTRI
jgi:hypothetical protein